MVAYWEMQRAYTAFMSSAASVLSMSWKQAWNADSQGGRHEKIRSPAPAFYACALLLICKKAVWLQAAHSVFVTSPVFENPPPLPLS